MFKNLIRTAAQKLLGFHNYLFVFSLLSSLRMRVGDYEKEFSYFMEMLPANGAILDIGANIGIMTVALARKCPQAVIYSFEPIPANIQALERVIRFYNLKNVQVFPFALGEKNSQVKMIMPREKKSKMQGLSHVVMPGEMEQEGEVFSIPMQEMDNIKELNNSERITAIKVDVENFELFVLKGGVTLLKKHHPLIYCELWDNDRRSQCITFLSNLGYRVMIYREGSLVDFTGQQAINFFFLPNA